MNIVKPIYVTKPAIPSKSEYYKEISTIFDQDILTNNGPEVQKLSHLLARYLGVRNVSLFVNGHAALVVALMSLGLKGEVITTPFTFASTTHAIVQCGLTPVFCDIQSDDCTMDPTKIEALITDKTCAIVPVHVFGNPCDTEAIEAIAKKHHLKVIYDAAHAFGVRYHDQPIGQYGDVSMFSFHATKVF